MRFEDSEQVAQLVDHRGYAILVAEFKSDLASLEGAMRMESNSSEEDARLTIRWKSLKSFIEKLEQFPLRECSAVERRMDNMEAEHGPMARP